MSNIMVCARFRPLNAKEKCNLPDCVCLQRLESESFIFKDEKQEEFAFSFDRVFYSESEQADVYDFVALPIIRDAINAINGAIITYGQTGAGKTYTMEGPSILECHEQNKGLLPRVVAGVFDHIKSSNGTIQFKVKLSMVEIYMEKVRDLLDLSKDNIQIKENRLQGIYLSGVTEISLSNHVEALETLSNGIANRAVGETQMNMSSSRSHCIYIFSIEHELATDKRTRTGKLILVDLAGSEKIEKTGAEGIILEEAKTINKSLSSLGNVINALTCSPQGKASHIPYRDSKLTRLLQDVLGGNARTALLCCCSPSPANASETLSTLRFGARAKHIKSSPRVNVSDGRHNKKREALCPAKDESSERILKTLRSKLDVEDVKLLEELFVLEGIFFDPNSIEDLDSAIEDITSRTISSLQQALEELLVANEKLKEENMALRTRIETARRLDAVQGKTGFQHKILGALKPFSASMR